jgi:PilZ domain
MLRINELTLAISGCVRNITPHKKLTARPFMKETSTMTQSPNGMEHRWGRRILVDLAVMVSADPAEQILGRMRNVSLSGALLRIDADLRLHALIEVCVELPPPSWDTARLLAHVARQCEEHVGIEWGEFAPTAVKDLLRSSTFALLL